MVEFNGERIDLISLCHRENIRITTVRSRLGSGMSLTEALSKPMRAPRGGFELPANEQGPAGVHPHKIALNSGFSA